MTEAQAKHFGKFCAACYQLSNLLTSDAVLELRHTIDQEASMLLVPSGSIKEVFGGYNTHWFADQLLRKVAAKLEGGAK